MGGGQTTIGHDTLGGRAAEDTHKGQLAGTAGHGLGVALGGGGGRLDGEVDAVLDNVAGGGGWRLPGEVGTVRRLADLDGGGGAGESRQARLEGGDLKQKGKLEIKFQRGNFFGFFKYDIQHCFICRPSEFTGNPGQLRLQHWLSDALTTRLDLIHKEIKFTKQLKCLAQIQIEEGQNIHNKRIGKDI
jgi:hypothetical protein